MLSLSFAFLSLVLVRACGDHQPYSRLAYDQNHMDKREYPQFPLTPPYRPLVWGDFNVIHTTDTHGWLLGHQKATWPEPNYSGDLGDFASFVKHMKDIAIAKDVDLLLVDSGDLHDGTGLSDGYPPGGVDAHESNKFLERLPYDLMTIGNHELYSYANALDMYRNFVPNLNGRYLSSNVNITILTNGQVVSVPIGNRYVKFTTRKGRRVTSLGVLYNFTGQDATITVQFVANMTKESWFNDAIFDEPDVFVLVGHMPVAHDNWPVVFRAIRAVHPLTPIMIFGGHSHVRDCQQYDGRSMALESGRYMETIGWMSANLDTAPKNASKIAFSRRYLDQNRVTYQYHTSTSNATFDTSFGRSITDGLHRLWDTFRLYYEYGVAPQNYALTSKPYPSNESVLSFYINDVLPTVLAINNTRSSVPHIIITDSGELRYDVFQGAFNRNDQLTAIPYTDKFLYIANVTFSVANQVLATLNNHTKAQRRDVGVDHPRHGFPGSRFQASLEEMDNPAVFARQDSTEGVLTLGYVTSDSCPDVGDDTQHLPVRYYSAPDYIGSPSPSVTATAPIDLVFVDFIENHLIYILNRLQSQKHYTRSDVQPYSPVKANEMLGLYAQLKWH